MSDVRSMEYKSRSVHLRSRDVMLFGLVERFGKKTLQVLQEQLTKQEDFPCFNPFVVICKARLVLRRKQGVFPELSW